MSHTDPSEERRLQYLARAEEALTKAEETKDDSVREWWLNVAKAWEYLADKPDVPGRSAR